MYVYHVVTDRPMKAGQQIFFNETHHNGVHQRVYDKIDIVKDIYRNPAKYSAESLEHHTSVAMRELALEEVRKKSFIGDATKCFDAQLDEQENLRLADIYWKNESNDTENPPIYEILVDGYIRVVEIIKEINANIK